MTFTKDTAALHGSKGGKAKRGETETSAQARLEYKEALEAAVLEHKYELADKLVERGLQGDSVALKEINDRILGKPIQVLSGDDQGGPIKVVIQQFSDKPSAPSTDGDSPSAPIPSA